MTIWNENRRQILLVGTVKNEMLTDFCTILQDKVQPGEPFEILMNSSGGINSVMTTLLSMLRTYREKGLVRIIGTGSIASAAVPLLAAGSKGERYILGLDTTLMLHETQNTFDEPTTLSLGELKAVVVKTQTLMDQYVRDMAELAGKDDAWWRERIPTHKATKELTAKEAVEWGIADKVVKVLPDELKAGDSKRAKAA